MNKIKNSTKIEMLCELSHNRVLEDCEYDNLSIDENGDYTEKGQDLFNEFYDYYESVILTYLKEIK
tara:strand:- start:682 stop:879 length:198 start_codon:yes stop_codon:yes gene_type:complete